MQKFTIRVIIDRASGIFKSKDTKSIANSHHSILKHLSVTREIIGKHLKKEKKWYDIQV